jgi:hypothetical protein
MVNDKEIEMGINQLSEKFNKIHESGMKGTQALGKLVANGANNLSQAHSSLANHVAKNVQMASVNMLTAKSPEQFWTAIKGNGGTPFTEEFNAYQQSMKKMLNDYAHEFSELNDGLFEHTKEGFNEFFKVACQNAPDGTEVFIQPYQSALNVCFDGMKKMQELMKENVDRVSGAIGQLNSKPSASSSPGSKKS